jgi:hypothetical protein
VRKFSLAVKSLVITRRYYTHSICSAPKGPRTDVDAARVLCTVSVRTHERPRINWFYSPQSLGKDLGKDPARGFLGALTLHVIMTTFDLRHLHTKKSVGPAQKQGMNSTSVSPHLTYLDLKAFRNALSRHGPAVTVRGA